MTQSAPRCAIVTDGLWRNGVSAIRSLGKGGFDVSVMGSSVWTTGFWSRYCRRRVKAPPAARDVESFGRAFLSAIEHYSRRGGRPVLLMVEDASLAWVIEQRESLSERAHFLLPPPQSFAIASDKGATQRAAQAIGILCPRTWAPADVDEFAKIAAELEPETFVTKPCSGRSSIGVTYGPRRSAAEWREHWQRFGPMLIQERVPPTGRGQGVSALMDRSGACVAAFAHERLQQYPNTGGPSTDRVSIDAPELVADSLRLLRHLSWTGLAMIEWKVDPRDGKPRLIEINPRLWGSLELAVRSGVDFPLLYARVAMGETVPAVTSYAIGVRCRWLMPGEILRYMTQPRDQRESLREFVRGMPGSTEEWDPSDMRGFLASIVCTGAQSLNPRNWKFLNR